MMYSLTAIHNDIAKALEVVKSNCPTPPGPPPRPGLVWNPDTCRWVRPKDAVQPEPMKTTPMEPRADAQEFYEDMYDPDVRRGLVVLESMVELAAVSKFVQDEQALNIAHSAFLIVDEVREAYEIGDDEGMANAVDDINEALTMIGESEADFKPLLSTQWATLRNLPNKLREGGGQKTEALDSLSKKYGRIDLEETKPVLEAIEAVADTVFSTFPEDDYDTKAVQADLKWFRTAFKRRYIKDTIEMLHSVFWTMEQAAYRSPKISTMYASLMQGNKDAFQELIRNEMLGAPDPERDTMELPDGSVRSSTGLSDRGEKEYLRWLSDFKPTQATSYVKVDRGTSLSKYIGSAYRPINRYLRTGKLDDKFMEERKLHGLQDEATVNRHIKRLIDQFKPIEQPYTVYRGMNTPFLNLKGGRVEAGDEIPLDAFTSTSRSVGTAKFFSRLPPPEGEERESSLIELRTLEDTNVMTLSDEDTAMYEQETIVNLGQRIRIDEVKEVTDDETIQRYIVATMLPNKPKEVEKGVISTLYDTLASIKLMVKSNCPNPPGPKPDKYGDNVDWNPEVCRWTTRDRHEPVDQVEPVQEPFEERPFAGSQLWENNPLASRFADGDWKAKHDETRGAILEDPTYFNVRNSLAHGLYTGDRFEPINQFIKYGAPEGYEGVDAETMQADWDMPMPFAAVVNRISKVMKPSEKPQKLYRGIPHELEPQSGFKNVRVGDVLTLDTFTSTSRNPITAAGFSTVDGQPDSTFIEIDVPEGARMTTFSNQNTDYNEFETLLDMGQQMEILEAHYGVYVPDDEGLSPQRVGTYIKARIRR